MWNLYGLGRDSAMGSVCSRITSPVGTAYQTFVGFCLVEAADNS
jgi:hypothetical protein